MKKTLKLLSIIFATALIAFSLSACVKTVVTTNENSVIILADSSVMTITETTTLKDYMDKLVEQEKLTFSGSDSDYGIYITKINGIEATGKTAWMLYTDDADNSTPAWGEITYNEKTYASANLGCESLVIKEGKTYIWNVTAY